MANIALALIVLTVFALRVRKNSARWGNGVYLLAGAFLLALGIVDIQPGGTGQAVLVAAALLFPLMVLLLTGFLLANGLTMLRREGTSPGNLLPLLAGLAIIANIAALIASALAGELAFLLAFASLALAVGYLGLLFSSFLAYLVFHSLYSRGTGHSAIIVLGAGLNGDKVTPLLAGRLDRAHRAYQREVAAGHTPVLITSGGQGPGETVAMADYLATTKGVPPEHLRRETLSTTTEENLLFSKRILEAESLAPPVLVVTSNYHTLRAAAHARALGLDVHTAGSRTARYFLPSAVLREFAAVLSEHKVAHTLTVLALALTPAAAVLAVRALDAAYAAAW